MNVFLAEPEQGPAPLTGNRERRVERLRYDRHVISEELGLSQKDFEDQYRDYERHLDRFHSLPKLEKVNKARC
jgi:hypothetical protein